MNSADKTFAVYAIFFKSPTFNILIDKIISREIAKVTFSKKATQKIEEITQLL